MTPQEASSYLSCVKALKKSHRFYDVHAHPYEVLFDKFSYEQEPARRGVLRLAGKAKAYAPPTIHEAPLSESDDAVPIDPVMLQRISQMQLTRTYGHVGAPVFDDEMELSGVDRALLLPVAPAEGNLAARLRWVKELYPDPQKFWVAGSVSGAVDGDALPSHLVMQRHEHGIKAVKCHPVVSAIDLGSSRGRGWLEMLLCGCGAVELPLVIHTGSNSPYWGGERGGFASLSHLKAIDWALSCAPVVLAHGGIYRCSPQEAEGWLPTLTRMIETHDNLFLDLSGVGVRHLKLLVKNIPIERLLFGSDALYISQWVAMAKVMHAFTEAKMKAEECIIRVASVNPAHVIFRE